MTYSAEWLQFCEAEEKYFACRRLFFRCDEVEMMNDLKQALDSVGYKQTALRYLSEIKSSSGKIEQLLSKIVEAAVDSSDLNTISLARSVLTCYKDDLSVRNEISLIAEKYFPGNDEWNYRRMAQMYELLSYESELLNLIKMCQTNVNPEIQEISADFQFSSK